MPKVSQDHKDERRNFIIDAAARCFAREGFHATSVSDVIKESGLSAGSVYRYFKNKDDLIKAIIEHHLENIVQRLLSISHETSTPADVVSTAIEIITSRIHTSNDRPLMYILPQIWSESIRNPEIRQREAAVYSVLVHHFEQIVVQSQQRQLIPLGLQPNATAQVMVALVQGYVLQHMIMPEKTNALQFCQTVRQLFSSHTALT
jgi:AcrR family transcriptional regulator